MKNLALKTETVRVLSGDELDIVDGGASKVSSALKPTNTNPTFVPPWLVTSSARKPPHRTVSSVRPDPNATGNPTFVPPWLTKGGLGG